MDNITVKKPNEQEKVRRKHWIIRLFIIKSEWILILGYRVNKYIKNKN